MLDYAAQSGDVRDARALHTVALRSGSLLRRCNWRARYEPRQRTPPSSEIGTLTLRPMSGFDDITIIVNEFAHFHARNRVGAMPTRSSALG
jgi:hypothetical protein